MANIEGEAELHRVRPDSIVNVAPKRPTLTTMVEEFRPLIARIDQAVSRVRTVTDRVNGTRPRPVDRGEDGGSKATEPSIIHDLRNQRDSMVRMLDQLDRELSALEECL